MTGIPKIGLGTSRLDTPEGSAGMLKALELGYRHIDTAQSYGTEAQVGEAIRRSGVPREEIFVTTKVADHRLAHDAFLKSVPESLKQLGLEQVDLLLVHWPNDAFPFEGYITALREAQERGWTRLIGVSNFTIAQLEAARTILGDGVLATNQVELHPFLQQPKLRDYARSVGLPLTAYQPIAKSTVTGDATLERIGKAHGVPATSVALAFLVAEGHIAIPASTKEEHLRQNLLAGDLQLTNEEIGTIRTLDRGGRRINPAKAPKWDD